MTLSEQQIRQVVTGMRMTDGEKARLTAQALAGDPGARLVVFAAWKRRAA